ncbi:MAG TPA: ABC transporter ATP-binding protein [Clostridia bacterium]|nr:ABC transporter ATP-binding protein [Clostridia bacterium]
MIAINVDNITRKYKSTNIWGQLKSEHIAVDNVSFDIKKGELFGLLGPNGAGKTTIIKMLTTLLLPTSGTAHIMNYDIRKDMQRIRAIINFTFGGDRGLYWRLSARDNLRYFADLYNVERGIADKRINEILELIGMTKWADDRVENYSKGMKQRLHIGKVLINNPDIIFFDEPTLGLDPVGAKDLRKIIVDLLELDKTILLTTHYMFEADMLCNRVAIINHGKIIANDRPGELKKLLKDDVVLEIEVYGATKERLDDIKKLECVESLNVKQVEQSQLIQIQLKENNEIINQILNILNDVQIKEIRNRKPTLEDVYIKLVGGINE